MTEEVRYVASVGTRRRVDPGRPAAIVAAAVHVMREQGVSAVTHRVVAEQAGVPLGATTQYFESLNDLLDQALSLLIGEFRSRANAWLSDAARSDPAGAVLEFLRTEQEARQKRLLVTDIELFVTASLRPALRARAREWAALVEDNLAEIVPREAAISVSALIESYELRRIREERDLTPVELAALRRHIRAILAADAQE